MKNRKRICSIFILSLILLCLSYIIWWSCFAIDYCTHISVITDIKLSLKNPENSELISLCLLNIDYKEKKAFFKEYTQNRWEEFSLQEGEFYSGMQLSKVYSDKVIIRVLQPGIKRGRPIKELFNRDGIYWQ